MTDIQSPATTLKHRKAASTGGGRAWSEAEEAFLIETRERKMPYKHIAAQLKKTELACRLHYHQLSFGSKSRHNHRNSNNSSSSNSSNTDNNHHHSRSSTNTTPISTTLPHLRTSSHQSDQQQKQQRPLPSFSPPASPPDKPILPRPHPTFPRAHTTSPLTHGHPLRLQTNNLTPRSQSIDLARLNNIYTTHRLHFWSVIAADYGGNLSPATLEDAWRRGWQQSQGGGSHFPPTPRGSPLSSRGESRERESSVFATSFSALPPATETGKFGGNSSLGGTWGEQRAPRSAFVGRRGSLGFARGEQPPMLPKLKCAVPMAAAATTTTPISTSRGGFSVGSLLTEDREVRSPAVSSSSGSGSERNSAPPAGTTPAGTDVIMQEAVALEKQDVDMENNRGRKGEREEKEAGELATVIESGRESA